MFSEARKKEYNCFEIKMKSQRELTAKERN
jgi:hypothetical protein